MLAYCFQNVFRVLLEVNPIELLRICTDQFLSLLGGRSLLFMSLLWNQALLTQPLNNLGPYFFILSNCGLASLKLRQKSFSASCQCWRVWAGPEPKQCPPLRGAHSRL